MIDPHDQAGNTGDMLDELFQTFGDGLTAIMLRAAVTADMQLLELLANNLAQIVAVFGVNVTQGESAAVADFKKDFQSDFTMRLDEMSTQVTQARALLNTPTTPKGN